MIEWLPLIWAGLISFIILCYVVLDGFDLGVGISFILFHDEDDRDVMMNSIAPIWDGNETWMILGAACLYAAFPIAFSTILPYLYIPLTLMVFFLIFRGACFEFRFKDKSHRKLWSICFSSSSIAIAFIQGYILGNVLLGVSSQGQHLSLLPFLAGLGVVVGYALLGLTWLIKKTSGKLQLSVFHFAKYNAYLLLLFFGLISLISPLTSEHIFNRWFQTPAFYYLMLLPLISVIVFIVLIRTISQKSESIPFRATILLFLLAYCGQCYSIWPYIIPYDITFYDAASPDESLIFMLVGVVLLLPVLIGYTIYTYYTFRGKSDEEHYH